MRLSTFPCKLWRLLVKINVNVGGRIVYTHLTMKVVWSGNVPQICDFYWWLFLPIARQISNSDNLVIRNPLLEGIAPSPSAVFFFRNFSATWRFNNLSLHCSSEVPYPPHISIADASVENNFRIHAPKSGMRTVQNYLDYHISEVVNCKRGCVTLALNNLVD